jgi:hypothetical protein
MRRYKNKHIFVFRKPINAIIQLSNISVEKIRSTVANNLADIDQSGEEVVMHLFRNQIDIQTNNSYTIFTYYFKAKKISVLDPDTKEFKILKEKSPEQLVYARLITPIITIPFNDMIKLMESKGDKGLLWGAIFDPEMILRIYDNRSMDQKGLTNGNKKKRTKCHSSYLAIEYLDIILYLGIEKGLLVNTKITLPKGPIRTGLDWLYAIKALNQASNEHAALNKLIQERGYYYAKPENLSKGESLYKLYVNHVIDNKKIKAELTEYLIAYFKDNNMIAYF